MVGAPQAKTSSVFEPIFTSRGPTQSEAFPAHAREVQRPQYGHVARSVRVGQPAEPLFTRRPRLDAAPSSRHGDAFRPVAVQKRATSGPSAS